MSDVRSVAVRLQAISRAAGLKGAPAAARAMGQLAARETALELSRYAHPRGTPTPAPPGGPPAVVSGGLRRSVRATEPTPGPRSQTTVGASSVQARIQELGGASGPGHRTILPPRPYLRPTVQRIEADGRLRRVAVEAFTRAVDGGV